MIQRNLCHDYVIMQWDPEVRDRVLCLIEDFGKGLPMPQYREAYEGLLVGSCVSCLYVVLASVVVLCQAA